MCDIVDIRCEDRHCTNLVNVHISDFCVPAYTVQARCGLHPPPDTEWYYTECPWVRFETPHRKLRDCVSGRKCWCDRECTLRQDRVYWLRYVGKEPLPEGYCVGTGSICPNTCHKEADDEQRI